ncbi:hypothetical protein Rumeso_03037 [Rubellimicrobium mesophilum DSM 19309]|uniref:Uncharacterized protein n=1 Tax=Rubellimicrobium mesophilum DSM 19309 TaxID=442562 RepID=A0A017HM39_9RHOB|nr:hypothetical protein [Rubellimicrobium mesophilum]EYD75390.1 hypothetical protein Rumeso_03037 [Rubellimicrobium mesophilum DSM 19309]
MNLVEDPVASRNACHWRLQVMADHTEEQVEAFVRIAVMSREAVWDCLETGALLEAGIASPAH